MNVDETVAGLRMLMFNARGNVLAYPEFGEDLIELLHRERGRRITDASRAYMAQAPADWGWPNARES
jgi:hypothetical protein